MVSCVVVPLDLSVMKKKTKKKGFFGNTNKISSISWPPRRDGVDEAIDRYEAMTKDDFANLIEEYQERRRR